MERQVARRWKVLELGRKVYRNGKVRWSSPWLKVEDKSRSAWGGRSRNLRLSRDDRGRILACNLTSVRKCIFNLGRKYCIPWWTTCREISKSFTVVRFSSVTCRKEGFKAPGRQGKYRSRAVRPIFRSVIECLVRNRDCRIWLHTQESKSSFQNISK